MEVSARPETAHIRRARPWPCASTARKAPVTESMFSSLRRSPVRHPVQVWCSQLHLAAMSLPITGPNMSNGLGWFCFCRSLASRAVSADARIVLAAGMNTSEIRRPHHAQLSNL